jgi:hypothetical protein
MDRLIGEIRAEAQRIGLALTVLKARKTVPSRDWKRKPVQVLAPRDAELLYRLVHHGPVVVTAVTAVFVSRDPRSNPIREKHAIRLQDFVEHKACYVLINGRTDVAALGPAVAEWLGVVRCDGQDDPRVLPLHSFDANGPCPDLAHAEGRKAFGARYGAGRLRLDEGGREWERAAALHGRETLSIAGYRLRAGFHWDVTNRKGSGTLLCANAVWHLPRRSYANVYPDGDVRGGSTDVPPIKKIWP